MTSLCFEHQITTRYIEKDDYDDYGHYKLHCRACDWVEYAPSPSAVKLVSQGHQLALSRAYMTFVQNTADVDEVLGD